MNITVAIHAVSSAELLDIRTSYFIQVANLSYGEGFDFEYQAVCDRVSTL